MKAAVVVFAVWVLVVPCVVVMFLTLALLAHSAYRVTLFLALSLTAAATLPAIVPVPQPRVSWFHRSQALPKLNHFQEKTHANCFDSRLGS